MNANWRIEQMISIVCVYNDEQVLRERLLPSLGSQLAAHEIITVDNRQSRFQSAAAALNWGAAQISGDWLLFAHQDVALLSEEWLARAEELLNKLNPFGWSGVAGSDATGRFRGMLIDRAHLSGEPFTAPMEVQTLDECLLIHRRTDKDDRYFDEGLTGWHAYGVDACCAAIRSGAQNYVLPLPVWHDSKTTNLAGLEEAHLYVWQKHGVALKQIATTCGVLPNEYGWADSSNGSLKRWWGRIETSYYHRVGGFPQAFHDNFNEVLERMTVSEPLVHCLHTQAWPDSLEAKAFVPIPRHPRQIVHHFSGWETGELESRCVVVASDLARQLSPTLEAVKSIAEQSRRVVICLDWEDRAGNRRRWKALERAAKEIHLTRRWDGSRVAIIVYQHDTERQGSSVDAR